MSGFTHPVGEIVVALRQERGLTQEQLADQAKVDRKTIQRLENGRRISADNLTRVADALAVTTTALYGPRGVTALLDLAEVMTCKYCGAHLIQSGTMDYENVDVEYEVFECGAANGLQSRPCPSDPRFPSFNDYSSNSTRITE